jgi:Fanconi anemia group D2 protein
MNFISSHGKREKDVNISREAPRVRKVCETFIHNVKSLMRQNGILDAFWGGNLKDKHIDGTVIIEDENVTDDQNCDDSTEDDSSTLDENEDEEL